MSELQTLLSEERGISSSRNNELKESRDQIAALFARINDMEGENLGLNQRLAEMAQKMEDQRLLQKSQVGQ